MMNISKIVKAIVDKFNESPIDFIFTLAIYQFIAYMIILLFVNIFV